MKVEINRYLFAMLGVQSLVELWWHRPNRNWDGKTPDEIYQSGPEGREQVFAYVRKCADGEW
ncbi:hypothetical protein EBT31_16960 [bacterium]|nr:hypothetical protein [bacterium]NBX49351.1 hypothetical protein [bacterium]